MINQLVNLRQLHHEDTPPPKQSVSGWLYIWLMIFCEVPLTIYVLEVTNNFITIFVFQFWESPII